jgi:hypothetical protein
MHRERGLAACEEESALEFVDRADAPHEVDADVFGDLTNATGVAWVPLVDEEQQIPDGMGDDGGVRGNRRSAIVHLRLWTSAAISAGHLVAAARLLSSW